MKKNTTVNQMDQLRQISANKKCFDCGEKGPTYVEMKYGVFICSSCSGIHRELCHKVKGITMCNFSDKEIEFLTKWGNESAYEHYMGDYK